MTRPKHSTKTVRTKLSLDALCLQLDVKTPQIAVAYFAQAVARTIIEAGFLYLQVSFCQYQLNCVTSTFTAIETHNSLATTIFLVYILAIYSLPATS